MTTAVPLQLDRAPVIERISSSVELVFKVCAQIESFYAKHERLNVVES
ncbi:hypothetical protein Poly24_31080 [Rosistilla carotiformis]|uniref:Uncharacterized protein n=1 Tax=Rosistilla carotiformis TaxID=2528017 RepID=A0A518JV22_9BACT|nr:hypothetical protein Poly24_31080 [Rosistilla carotiformis]